MKDHKKEKEHSSKAASTKVNDHLKDEETQKNQETKSENQEVIDKDEQIATLNDKYIRLAAEFDNYRRRTLKEKQELIFTAGEEIIKGILPVLDDFERAIEMLNQAGDSGTALEGTELIYNKLNSFLASKGVKRIEAKGADLDTDFHEAVAQYPAPSKELKNKIVDVVQQGYTLNGKVIRFSKVVVGQ